MGKKIDLTGQRFGRLVALRQDFSSKRVKWFCRCDCGKIKSVQSTHLRSGKTTSCGCYQKEKVSKANFKHGYSKNSLYSRWKAIKQRCENPNNRRYKDYGARGISVCEAWKNFQIFKEWALNNGYQENLELDRIDNNKGYFPENCRWCETVTNNRNRRITAKIEGTPLKDFAQQHNMTYGLVHTRYYQLKKKGIEPTTHNILTYANQLPLNEETR